MNFVARFTIVATAVVIAAAGIQLAPALLDPPAAALPGGERPDGTLPDNATLDDTHYAGIANLDPALLAALRSAAAAAPMQFFVTSGWRSPDYQRQLLAEAVTTYGSEQEAARWVATPETSAHVAGDAVDIGSWDAAEWLGSHGSAYGLCQIYDNEAWHFELRPSAVTDGCPRKYFDPTYDPRMQG
jgi:hypothetical protein